MPICPVRNEASRLDIELTEISPIEGFRASAMRRRTVKKGEYASF